MNDSATTESRRRTGHYVVHTLFTVVAGAAVAVWLLTAIWLAMLRCDENCSDGQADNWQYGGQFWLAVFGALLAVVGLGVGFTARKHAYRGLLTVALGSAVLWWTWVTSGGF